MLSFSKPYIDTARVTKSDLKVKIGSFYWYIADFQIKKGVHLILRYPIQKQLGNLKRIDDKIFYGKVPLKKK